MNKKFSTLVAGILLATSSMAFAAGTVTKYTDAYKTGKAYLIQVGGEYLTVNGDKKAGSYTLSVAADNTTDLSIQKMLWEVKVVPAESGAISPKFILTNRYTGTVLALDKSKAIGKAADYNAVCSNLGGDLVEWFGVQPSTTKPIDGNVLYAPYSDDKVVVLAYEELNGDNAGKEVYAKIINKTDLVSTTTGVITLTPYTYDDPIYLSANDLNTQFGANGIQNTSGNLEATKDSYFKLNTTVSEGQLNAFGTELQARAVAQWELKYGLENAVIGDGAALTLAAGGTNPTLYFASLYAVSSKTLTSKDNIQAVKDGEDLTAYKSDATVLALYSKSQDKYVVVDTAYYKGTPQTKNEKVEFAYDGLYNAKNDTRYRLPQSYLFKFKYNATDNTVEIESLGYLSSCPGDKDTKKWVKESTDLSEYYGKDDVENGYSTGVVKLGSLFPNTSVDAANVQSGVAITVAAETAKNYVNYATLVDTKVLTLSSESTPIKVGLQSEYELTYLPAGVYTFKVTGVYDPVNKDRIGKYWVMSLGGSSEYVEQAPRQNFQNMPAAQWVVESLGSSTYTSPIKITNREFENAFAKAGVTTSGLIYKGGEGKIFFFGGDTLEYVAVAKANDAKLGYKYITDEEMKEAVYTFNYLHELAMDKPINTINNKDSAVWVDKDGSVMKFQLEKVIDDAYGYNAGSKTIAQLQRLVYKIRVKDATKLQNDGRYLAYNETSKKYYVSTDKASTFFLKENNTLEEGTPYYTLVEANLVKAIPAKLKNFNAVTKIADELDYSPVEDLSTVVADNDLVNVFVYPTDAKVADAIVDENGLKKDGYAAKEFAADAEAPVGTQIVKIGADKYYAIYNTTTADYAKSKVAVDNNTLALVNGVLENKDNKEVNNSAFAVTKDDSKLYRTIGDAQGEVKNGSNVLNFFRVNATEKEYLYEDANSVYSKGLGLNFLGVEGKGDAKNCAMLVTYTHGDFMPQYLIALDTTKVEGTQVICDVCGKLDCEHSKTTPGYIDGRFLVNLTDSISAYADVVSKSKFQLGKMYTRLAFVDARLMGDSLIIKNSVYTGNKSQIKPSEAKTIASMDTINLALNKHNPALFQFRLINDTNNFMIESESWDNGKAFAGAKAPKNDGGWIKIQNGVPVVIRTDVENAYNQAEIFNVELTDKAPVSVEGADVATVVVTGGNGIVTVQNAAGMQVIVSTVLGQELANTIATSDNAQISVSATGVVFVTVAGETTKVVVKQ